MKKMRFCVPILVVLCISLLAGCGAGGEDAADADESAGEEAELTLTLEELAQYDGKDGSPAYVAVDGVIYDVTDVPQWKNGEHNGYSAGQDLTDIIKNESPHGVSKLRGIPVVGQLAD